MSLIKEMFNEMNRCREILKEYESIPEGAFGAAIIRETILQTERSIQENDVVEMLRCFQELKEIK